MKAEAALVGAGRALLLRVGGDERGVDVEDEALGDHALLPGTGSCSSACRADAGEQRLVEALEAAVGGRVRGHRPEEHLLVAQGAEVGERIAAVGEHHGEVAHDAPGLVAHPAGVEAQGLGECSRQPQSIGQTAKQRGTRAGSQAGQVAGDFK